ncbi:hypothetical protein QVD17_08029 [Tagetes erecta]|uniref:Uncharacterized protein n=1 Tax=Tagetes erecta TaxID=13708 RepID=A0AAD8P435_TARER|nr:hypothetical protein QVD17_08029 [Tagetes erecta]
MYHLWRLVCYYRYHYITILCMLFSHSKFPCSCTWLTFLLWSNCSVQTTVLQVIIGNERAGSCGFMLTFR